jgi:hypothetical protein
MSLSSPPGTSVQSPRDFDKSDTPLPQEVQQLPENLQNLLMGCIASVRTTTKTRKIVMYVCAADSQGNVWELIFYRNNKQVYLMANVSSSPVLSHFHVAIFSIKQDIRRRTVKSIHQYINATRYCKLIVIIMWCKAVSIVHC